MKTGIIIMCALLLKTTIGYPQSANQTLSNLVSPTAINQSLFTASDNTIDLGSGAKSWKNIYLDGSIYLKGNRFISNGNNTNNTFVGTKAGNVTTGVANVFNGAFSGYLNTTGHDNTALGYFSLYANKVTYQNTAVGSQALFSNEGGYYNTGIGYFTLHDNVSGFYNTAVGTRALDATLSSGNTALGERAGAIYKNGWGNTFIGQQTWANADGYEYSTCLGYDSHITASNQVRIGRSSTTSIGGFRAWTNFSDGRFKKNIKEDVPGLAFINRLTPITYTLDLQSINNEIEKNTSINSNGIESVHSETYKKLMNESEKIRLTGFVAQEVEKIAKDLDYDFDGVDAPKNKNDFYGLRYAEFVVPLVKAVQELDVTSKIKDERITKLETEVMELRQIMANLKNNNSLNSQSTSAGYLLQNNPNPFNSLTIIRYFIPENSKSAKLLITNMNGQTLKALTINSVGEGQTTISSSTLPSGTYNYSLWIEGKVVDTKQLSLVK